MKRTGSAVWRGGLKDGKGQMSAESGALRDADYAVLSRFGEGQGTNPEELIGAALAGCFSMALAGEIGKSGVVPRSIHTNAVIEVDRNGGSWSIVSAHIDVSGEVPGMDDAAFVRAAETAKRTCPVSRLLKLEPTLHAGLLAEAA